MSWRTDQPRDYQEVLICLMDPDEITPRPEMHVATRVRSGSWVTAALETLPRRKVVTHWISHYLKCQRSTSQEASMASKQSLGGLAVAKKHAPLNCPKCNKPFPFATPWHSYLGHLGLHGLADRHFNGDLQAAQRRLRENGVGRLEAGASWSNGAWPAYRPITED